MYYIYSYVLYILYICIIYIIFPIYYMYIPFSKCIKGDHFHAYFNKSEKKLVASYRVI